MVYSVIVHAIHSSVCIQYVYTCIIQQLIIDAQLLKYVFHSKSNQTLNWKEIFGLEKLIKLWKRIDVQVKF